MVELCRNLGDVFGRDNSSDALLVDVGYLMVGEESRELVCFLVKGFVEVFFGHEYCDTAVVLYFARNLEAVGFVLVLFVKGDAITGLKIEFLGKSSRNVKVLRNNLRLFYLSFTWLFSNFKKTVDFYVFF